MSKKIDYFFAFDSNFPLDYSESCTIRQMYLLTKKIVRFCVSGRFLYANMCAD